jgi:hypothetical protein
VWSGRRPSGRASAAATVRSSKRIEARRPGLVREYPTLAHEAEAVADEHAAVAFVASGSCSDCGLLARLSTVKSQGYPTSYPQALKRRLDDDSREKGTALESPWMPTYRSFGRPRTWLPTRWAVPSDCRRPLACHRSLGVVTRAGLVMQAARNPTTRSTVGVTRRLAHSSYADA